MPRDGTLDKTTLNYVLENAWTAILLNSLDLAKRHFSGLPISSLWSFDS